MSVIELLRKHDPTCPKPFLQETAKEWAYHFKNHDDIEHWLIAGVFEPERAAYLHFNGVPAGEFLAFSEVVAEFSNFFIIVGEYKPGHLARAYKLWKDGARMGDIICEIVEGAY